MRTSLPLTEIWPISDRFIKQNTIASLCITVQYALLKIVSDKFSKLDSKLSDIWNYFRTMSDGRRQTESLKLMKPLSTALGYSYMVECLPVDPASLVRFPTGTS